MQNGISLIVHALYGHVMKLSGHALNFQPGSTVWFNAANALTG
jgi:hypothetical protein